MNGRKVGAGGGNQAGGLLYCLMRLALSDNLTCYQKLDDASGCCAVSFLTSILVLLGTSRFCP